MKEVCVYQDTYLNDKSVCINTGVSKWKVCTCNRVAKNEIVIACSCTDDNNTRSS